MKMRDLIDAAQKLNETLIEADVPKETKNEVTVPQEPEDGFFLVGFWNNAYSRNSNKEYFWAGPYQERKNAVAIGKRLQQSGQPKSFSDWGKGENKIVRGVENFKKICGKVGLNPNLTELYFKDY